MNSKLTMLEDALNLAMSKVCPTRHKEPRQIWITENTWVKLQHQGDAWKIARELGSKLQNWGWERTMRSIKTQIKTTPITNLQIYNQIAAQMSKDTQHTNLKTAEYAWAAWNVWDDIHRTTKLTIRHDKQAYFETLKKNPRKHRSKEIWHPYGK